MRRRPRKCIAQDSNARQRVARRCRRWKVIREALLMFLIYFNKLGWSGSLLVSVVVTLVLILAFRLIIG